MNKTIIICCLLVACMTSMADEIPTPEEEIFLETQSVPQLLQWFLSGSNEPCYQSGCIYRLHPRRFHRMSASCNTTWRVCCPPNLWALVVYRLDNTINGI